MIIRFLVFLCLVISSSSNAQQILSDPTHHLSFELPAGWTYSSADSVDSFSRFKCFNADRSIMVEIYAMKSKGTLDLKKFNSALTSVEKGLGKSLGEFQNSERTRISGVRSIGSQFLTSTESGRKIDVKTLSLVKKQYGYFFIFKIFSDIQDRSDLMKFEEDIDLKIPRSLADWFFLLAFIVACLFALGYSVRQLVFWLRPLNVRAIFLCLGMIGLALLALFFILLLFETIGLVFCLIGGGVLLFLSINLPAPKPVTQAFENAIEKDTAGTYRAFLQKYPTSIGYRKMAKTRMHSLISTVVDKYKIMVSGNDTPIVKAIMAMFEYIKHTDNFMVGVRYNSINRIKNQTEQYKAKNLKVLSAEKDFTEKKNRKRERFITALINYAFHNITPDDLLGFSTLKSKPEEGIFFEVDYTIQSSGVLFYRTKEKDLPDEEKTQYAGVEFLWSLKIIIPDHAEKYKFSFKSKPASQFSTRGDSFHKVYDAMASSAFSDFCRVFIHQSGLAPTFKDVITKSVLDGEEKVSLNISRKDIAEGLVEFLQEEDLDMAEISHEFGAMLADVASSFAEFDFSGGFSFDISFD